ncbi:MAG TPA: M14 family metallocarboxypeptidase, partial [Phycisphaerales bacterium]|nr:M14 family metallocarboxypeptidase [Phycisphaerales bacterium]
MRRTAAVLASIVFLVVPASGQPYAVPGDPGVVRYDGYASVRVSVTTPGQMLAVTSLMDMLMSESSGVGTFDVLLAPGKIEALDQLGIDYEVLDPDIQTSIDAESRRLREQRDREQGGLVEPRGGRSWFDDYKDLDAILAQLDAVAASKPQITVVETIGQSLESRPIKAIRITGPGGPGNRPAVFYHGGQHAREWITPMTIMYFADRLVGSYGSDARVTDLLNNVEIILVPVMNPDGYSFSWTNQRLWRKNRRDNGNGTWGVDLNRNWGYQWGGEGASTSPSSETYRGPSPFSEPETQVMRDFITANPRIRVHIDFHSYSQLILSPWGYTSDPPPDASTFNMLNAELKAAVERLYGTPYVAGPTYTTIYPASGGSADWTYGARGILGWAWELRDKGQFGFILPPEQIIPTGQETIECILLLAEYVAYPFVYSFPAPLPATVIAGQTTDAVVEIKPRTG